MNSTNTLGKTWRTALLVAALVQIAACSSLKFPGVYKIGILQGNIVDQKKLNQVELGMTRTQVRYLLGTPLLIDTFNQERWDYYYSFYNPRGTSRERRFSVFFEDDKLVRYEGDIKPGVTNDQPIRENIEAIEKSITKDEESTLAEKTQTTAEKTLETAKIETDEIEPEKTEPVASTPKQKTKTGPTRPKKR